VRTESSSRARVDVRSMQCPGKKFRRRIVLVRSVTTLTESQEWLVQSGAAGKGERCWFKVAQHRETGK